MDQTLLAGLAGLQCPQLLPLLVLGLIGQQQQRQQAPPQNQGSHLQQAAQNAADAYVRAVSAFEEASATAQAAFNGVQPQFAGSAPFTPMPGMHGPGMPAPCVQTPGSSTAAKLPPETPEPKPADPAEKQMRLEKDTMEEVTAHNNAERCIDRERRAYEKAQREEVKRSDARVAAFEKQLPEKKESTARVMQPKPKKRPVQDTAKDEDSQKKPQEKQMLGLCFIYGRMYDRCN